MLGKDLFLTVTRLLVAFVVDSLVFLRFLGARGFSCLQLVTAFSFFVENTLDDSTNDSNFIINVLPPNRALNISTARGTSSKR